MHIHNVYIYIYIYMSYKPPALAFVLSPPSPLPTGN